MSITRDDPLWADTWVTGRDVAEIKLLVVDDERPRRGLGSALLDAVDDRLAAAGVHDQVIGAIEPNAAAIRLYERRGFRPAWLADDALRGPAVTMRVELTGTPETLLCDALYRASEARQRAALRDREP